MAVEWHDEAERFERTGALDDGPCDCGMCRLGRAAEDEAERRVEASEGLRYDMEVGAFVLGALWAAERQQERDLPTLAAIKKQVEELMRGGGR